MIGWTERKCAELLAKLASVEAELGYWRDQATVTGRLPKHHMQIERVTGQLMPVISHVRDDIGATGLDTGWRELERRVLELHRVWDFFREKLALRYVDSFVPYLLAADEFAWACYRPMQQALQVAGTVESAAVREPPLVFFAPVTSPFSMPRGTSFAADVGGAALVSDLSRQLTERLPLPVVGVPWYQLHHLPDALVIGHEVGHHVERDGSLTTTVRGLIAGAVAESGDEGRRADWERWASEVFADVYAVLCGGPAFVRALGDFLVVGGPAGQSGRSAYPPVTTRIALALATVAILDTAAARELQEGWAEDGVEVGGGDRTAETVARTLVGGPYPAFGGVALTDVVSFGRQQIRDHRNDADRLLAGAAPHTKDARTLLAAAGRAYAQSPADYARARVQDQVLDRMRAIQEPGVRAAHVVQPVDLSVADARAAERLYTLLVGE